ncbi:hypothetical protein JOL62DRAFT_87273 [Phyllosticta paracitricarpa]|uniref:Uncharacterized protein n=1 Tax=Phyllosticta paracitricarpa TaxID=2016321 RepID=A0ABR1NAC9_9PEZI
MTYVDPFLTGQLARHNRYASVIFPKQVTAIGPKESCPWLDGLSQTERAKRCQSGGYKGPVRVWRSVTDKGPFQSLRDVLNPVQIRRQSLRSGVLGASRNLVRRIPFNVIAPSRDDPVDGRKAKCPREQDAECWREGSVVLIATKQGSFVTEGDAKAPASSGVCKDDVGEQREMLCRWLISFWATTACINKSRRRKLKNDYPNAEDKAWWDGGGVMEMERK